jgi:type II secretory pathway pseudopilin PulG
MIKHTRTRRAFGLVVVLIAMTTVAGLVTLLSLRAAHAYDRHRRDRVRSVAQAIADSSAAYARAHQTEWTRTWPVQPIGLDIKALLPPDYTGSAILGFETTANRHVCRINARAALHSCEVTDELNLPIPHQIAQTTTYPGL